VIYKETAKDIEMTILKILGQDQKEVLGAFASGKKHRQDFVMNHQHLNSVPKVNCNAEVSAFVNDLM